MGSHISTAVSRPPCTLACHLHKICCIPIRTSLCAINRQLHLVNSAGMGGKGTGQEGEAMGAHLSKPQAKQKNKRKTGVVDLHMV